MRKNRDGMQARVVPLASREAGDSFVEGTPSQRVALVAELSRRAWALTGRPVLSYTRATMPVRIITLQESRSGE